MSSKIQQERGLLLLSTVSSFSFAVIGIVLGSIVGSLVIVFDGAYSLVSLVLTMLSLGAAHYINKPEVDKNTPQFAMIEPSVIAIKGSVIAVMCLWSFYSAVEAILAGGRDINAGVALAFGMVSVVGCYATYRYIKLKSQNIDSALAQAEAKQWVMDTVISVAVLAGFFIAKLLMMTKYADYATYADPVMVVLASVYFIIVPVKMVWHSVHELLDIRHHHGHQLAHAMK
ncbi:cation transporter [Photobacterium leiognathi subsp. mandapamensis]|uniref:cation transporter n=1 Tax=Photobacterium leiognathi TaxID=553611 RepID=UPI000D15DA30|nr:cation transporter [Photobacterium leiognathi]PSW65504.1 cation transporter [Photobacterium leiognathi subsp. mandapamensis]